MLRFVTNPYVGFQSYDVLDGCRQNLLTLRRESVLSINLRGTGTKRSPRHSLRLSRVPIRAGIFESLPVRTDLSRAPHISLTATVRLRRKELVNLEDQLLKTIGVLSSLAGQKVTLQLVSNDVDPATQIGKRSQESSLRGSSEHATISATEMEYTAEFVVSQDFGLPGAIIVVNEHQTEFFLETICLDGLPNGKVFFPCYSWVHPKHENPEPRLFFSNQVYMPSATPPGLKELREQELLSLRGNGKGTRAFHDRIYDYALYNDLGNPDKSEKLVRKTLGNSKELPYPRRCRTGRSPSKTDPHAESVLRRGSNYYVPRDETFEEVKEHTFVVKSLKVVIHKLLPKLIDRFDKDSEEFHRFTEIDRLYREGMVILESEQTDDILKHFSIPNFITKIDESISLQFTEPQLIAHDKFAWLRDDEFGREVLAGINPLHIECLKTFPPVSSLDPKLFGPRESAIKAEHIERHLCGLSLEKAIEQEKLFILDYHDAFLPFINKINALDGHKIYASRTIFYLTELGTLIPIAIELCLPPSTGFPGSQRVFTPGQNATDCWLWKLAKAHVASNDAGFHQLVNHWLRTHAVTEPYVIASHRQLSSMHPIFKLLHPHLRYTMEINSAARQLLINADGAIESFFTSGPYSMEISSAAYRSSWRFDMEALPADLIKRGMAVEDPSCKPHGLRLVIEDYPYAADGLLIWSAIRSWVDDYVSIYYSDPEILTADYEIQQWWEEIRNIGHADKKDEAWWPELKTKEDLVAVITNIIWVASGHHAAVNFGQYAYAGYVPNHSCITRRLIPEPVNDKEFKEFVDAPEKFFLSTISNKLQATVTMAVLDSLSTHAPDEEYLGNRVHANWTADDRAMAASLRFSKRLEEVEEIINMRNKDTKLKNRWGAGVVPYEVLVPTSPPGVTGRGVPNSISI